MQAANTKSITLISKHVAETYTSLHTQIPDPFDCNLHLLLTEVASGNSSKTGQESGFVEGMHCRNMLADTRGILLTLSTVAITCCSWMSSPAAL